MNYYLYIHLDGSAGIVNLRTGEGGVYPTVVSSRSWTKLITDEIFNPSLLVTAVDCNAFAVAINNADQSIITAELEIIINNV